jgi:glycosyltransferase involved in cell wall biosynthesis
LREVVRDGVDGLLVPAGNPGALAAALRKVLDDPVLRQRLAEAGRSAARRFDPATAAARVAAVLDGACR